MHVYPAQGSVLCCASHHAVHRLILKALPKKKLRCMPTSFHPCLLTDVISADPNASEQLLVPTSPKSIEACFRLGIDPLELQFTPVANFKRAGETDELTQLRFQHQEELRQVGAPCGSCLAASEADVLRQVWSS